MIWLNYISNNCHIFIFTDAQVACDYLWTKTVIEKAFRIWSLAAGSNSDKRLFREVLIQLYKYVTKSLITWLTQHGPSIPSGSPVLDELAKVIELLLKSVQCIAHHGSLSKTHKRLSLKNLFSGRALAPMRPPTNRQDDKSNNRKKFSVRTQKRLESAFVEQMKYLRRDIGQRKNSVKCARWLALAVPQEVQNEPMLLRADSLASISPISPTTPYTPQLPQRMAEHGNATANTKSHKRRT
ncbi:hypothetical protein BIW11_08008 [Tropilaelaps mercedesae]|uniref:Uncharacterized protein n=1 Tax=Tropilaelaps mercedesae TaxID=418985 RepID=A0A1V9XRF4_9ACAR|nr:hypothetical protein BIW11_08008 [Tropilaelaps mercedesae]